MNSSNPNIITSLESNNTELIDNAYDYFNKKYPATKTSDGRELLVGNDIRNELPDDVEKYFRISVTGYQISKENGKI